MMTFVYWMELTESGNRPTCYTARHDWFWVNMGRMLAKGVRGKSKEQIDFIAHSWHGTNR